MKSRSYTPDDYPRIIAFLRELYTLDIGRPYWLPARWEYASYLVSPLYLHRGFPDWTRTIRIWENDDGDIVALVNSENPDKQAYFHVHPAHRDLEGELIQWAEVNIAQTGGGGKELVVWSAEDDAARESLLAARGYVVQEEKDFLLWQDLGRDTPTADMPEGYTLHSMKESVDLDEKVACMTGAFQSDPYPVRIYRKMQEAPSYRPELDLFTRDARGSIASFCIIWLDEPLSVAYFEPVGTNTEHQRMGLGKATLCKGLQRLKGLGVTRAFVGASGQWRRSFYQSAGFYRGIAHRPWSRRL
jgi:ribosomal protein S18 acetylase RimI-like enzyme